MRGHLLCQTHNLLQIPETPHLPLFRNHVLDTFFPNLLQKEMDTLKQYIFPLGEGESKPLPFPVFVPHGQVAPWKL